VFFFLRNRNKRMKKAPGQQLYIERHRPYLFLLASQHLCFLTNRRGLIVININVYYSSGSSRVLLKT